MSKASLHSNDVTVGNALSLAAEVTKALSPVLRGLTQEQVNGLRRNPLQLQDAFRKLITGSATPICLQDKGPVTEFFLDNVRNELSEDKREDIQLDLNQFVFGVYARKITMDSYALKIEGYSIIKSAETANERVLSEKPIWALEFESLVGMMCAEDSLVPVQRLYYFGSDLGSKITEEYLARNAILKFGNSGDDLFVGLQIGDKYIEEHLDYGAIRRFEKSHPVQAA